MSRCPRRWPMSIRRSRFRPVEVDDHRCGLVGRQFGEIKFVLAGVENEPMPKDEAI